MHILVDVERRAIGNEVSVTVRGFEEGHKQHLSTPPRSISYIYYSPITLQPPLLFTSYSSNIATFSSLDGLSSTFSRIIRTFFLLFLSEEELVRSEKRNEKEEEALVEQRLRSRPDNLLTYLHCAHPPTPLPTPSSPPTTTSPSPSAQQPPT